MRFRSISTLYPGRLAQTWEEHRQLVEAIASHNVEKAKKVAVLHMTNAERTLLKEIEQNEAAAQSIRDGAED
jgi:DNA-binding GntR family transcriptional regulator